MKVFLRGFAALVILFSCSTEKVNMSPLSQNLSSGTPGVGDLLDKSEKSLEIIKYSSDITNSLVTIPKFKNEEVNKEVIRMKFYLSEYINAVKKYDHLARLDSYTRYTNSYKKIQKLRTQLPADDREIINRFMVKIKTNMSLLESLKIDADTTKTINQ